MESQVQAVDQFLEIRIAQAISRAVEVLQPRQTPDELLTVAEVGQVLGVGKNFANKLVQSGVIRGLRMNGMKVRRRELESWMQAMDGMDLTDPFHPVPIQREDKVSCNGGDGV